MFKTLVPSLPCDGSKSKGVIQELRIELSKSAYYAGEIVDGCLIVIVNDDYVFDGIVAQLQGGADVRFYGYRKQCQERREYVNMYQQLKRCGHDNCEVNNCNAADRMHRGRHVFPFSFHLPINLPASFIEINMLNPNEMGSVRYVITMSILRSGSQPRTIFADLIVLLPYDLVTNELERAVTMYRSEDIYTCFRYSGQYQVQVMLDKQGYRPGDIIKIAFTVQNYGRSQPWHTTIKLHLRRILTFRTLNHAKTNYIKYSYFRALIGQVFEVPIPHEVTDSYTCCDLIKVQYEVVIKIIVHSISWNNRIAFNIPVTIGKKPIA